MRIKMTRPFFLVAIVALGSLTTGCQQAGFNQNMIGPGKIFNMLDDLGDMFDVKIPGGGGGQGHTGKKC